MIRLGIDFGGVIIQARDDVLDTSFGKSTYKELPEVSGAFDSIAYLVDNHFQDGIFVLATVPDRRIERVKEWLLHHNFYGRTRLPISNVLFVKAPFTKAIETARLGLSHYVDDSLAILDMVYSPNRYLFNPSVTEPVTNPSAMQKVTQVDTWTDLVYELER